MRKTMVFGIFGIVVGLLVFGAAMSADYTNLNFTQKDREAKDFGWLQALLSVAGVLGLFTGIVLMVFSIRMQRVQEASDPGAAAELGSARVSDTASGEASPAEDASGTGAQGQEQEGQQGQGSAAGVARPSPQISALSADRSSSSEGEDKADLEDLNADVPPPKEEGTGFDCPDCGEPIVEGVSTCPACAAVFDRSRTAKGFAVS